MKNAHLIILLNNSIPFSMNIQDTFEYRLEKWRIEEIFGLKKIVWMITIVLIVLTIPMYLLGRLLANTLTIFNPTTSSVQINKGKFPILEQEQVQIFTYSDGSRNYIQKINNKNSTNSFNTGISPWIYSFATKNANGETIDSGSSSYYILPNVDNYIVGDFNTSGGINFEVTTNTELSTPVNYTDTSELPVLNVSNILNPREIVSTNFIELGFSVLNSSSYKIKNIDCIYLMRNVDSQVIGAGKYTIDELDSKDSKTVKLKYPNPDLGTKTSLEVITQYNYLNPDTLTISLGKKELKNELLPNIQP
jgi:hypothetical protein